VLARRVRGLPAMLFRDVHVGLESVGFVC